MPSLVFHSNIQHHGQFSHPGLRTQERGLFLQLEHLMLDVLLLSRDIPILSSLTQAQINQVYAERPSPVEVKEHLTQGFNDVTVIAVTVGALASLPAHHVREQHSGGTETGKIYSSTRVVTTTTPGNTWTVSCGSEGQSFEESEKNYQHWQNVINNIIFSFQFSSDVTEITR